MKIKTIEVDNFLSFRNKQVLDFATLNNINFLIGLNGSGKSNLFKAIQFGNLVCDYNTKQQFKDKITNNNNRYNHYGYRYNNSNSELIEKINNLYKNNSNDNYLFTSNKNIVFSITYQIQFFDIKNITNHFVNKMIELFYSNRNVEKSTIDFLKNDISSMFKKICDKRIEIKNTYQIYQENKKVNISNSTEFVNNKNYDIKNLLLKRLENQDNQNNRIFNELIDFFNEYLFNEKLNINFYDLYELVIWKPNDKYNLQSSIDLYKFIQNPNEVSIPLNNICKLINKLTQNEVDLFSLIKELVNNNNKDQVEIARIENNITKHINTKVNNYLKDVWYDFKNKEIQIFTKISNNMLFFYILNSHNINNELSIIINESDGFKQMLSILLTLTSDFNNQGKLILIDEPEVHLHPSSIVALRKELFDMSYRNQIIVSTHSPFMVDRNNLDWYHELEWKNGESIIYSDIIKTRSKNLPKIIESCFGTDAISNFKFSKINLLVEGKTDLDILEWIFKDDPNLNIRVQQGDGIHIPKYLENIYNNVPKSYFYKNTVILVDNDNGGKEISSEIKRLDIYKDKNPTIINYAQILNDNNITTLESLYDLDKYQNEIEKLKSECETNGEYKLQLAQLVEQKDAIKQEYKKTIIKYFKELQEKNNDN